MPLIIDLQLQLSLLRSLNHPDHLNSIGNLLVCVVSLLTAYNDLIIQQLVSFHSDIINDLYINCFANCVYDHHMHQLSRVYKVLVDSIVLSGNACFGPTGDVFFSTNSPSPVIR